MVLQRKVFMNALFVFGIALILVAGLGVTPAQAGPFHQSTDEGETLFNEKCVACHSIGRGVKLGPDLKGVTQRRETAWLTAWILNPDKMLAANDPIAMELLAKHKNIPMPNMKLTEAQVTALIAFFEKVDSGELVYAPPKSSLPPGDSAAGKALFMGETRFTNGGPACMSCHSVTGIGALGGGALGPDLTEVYTRYGEAGLPASLDNPSTTTMNAVWSAQPLTDQERAHLVAFFKASTVTARPASALLSLAGLSGGSTIALIVAAHLFWRKRLNGVRKPMIARANAKK